MKWLEAFYAHVDKPTWTNRESSGVIRFARSLVNTYAKDPAISLTPWDWYAFSLPALGWSKPGDRFKVDTKHQLQPYPAFGQLRAALVTLASELDDANVAFRLIVDPRGTDAVFRKLAADAWAAMKTLGKGGDVPELLARQWEAQLGPEGAAATVASADPKAAAAAVPLRRPRQHGPIYEAQPLDEPLRATPTKKNGGGGIGVFLLLLALGRKRKRGRR